MAHREGLIPKKIKRKGGGLATYWVKPADGEAQLVRLKKAKFEFSTTSARERLAASVQATRDRNQQTLDAWYLETSRITATPASRRGPTTSLAPGIEPPKISISVKAFRNIALTDPEGKLTTDNISIFLRANKDQIKRMGSEIDVAFVNPKGTKNLDAVSDINMNLIAGRGVQGAYNPTTGDMMIRKGHLIRMAELATSKSTPTEDQINSAQIWTHEQLHAASNMNKPKAESLDSNNLPNRWLEEATTELLSHPYNAQVVTALSGAPLRKALPIEGYTTMTGDRELGVIDNAAYRSQCERFMNLAGYIAGVRSTDSLDEVNRSVLGYAAEVKKRGADRYEYLAGEVLKGHGIKQSDGMMFYAAAHGAMAEKLKEYMGLDAISEMHGRQPYSVETIVSQTLRFTYQEMKQRQAAQGMDDVALITPLAVSSVPVASVPPVVVAPITGSRYPTTPPKKKGPRSTLKVRL